MAEEVLYSAQQVAVLLKVHPLTVRRYIKEGKLRAVKIAGNVRIPSSSIDAFTQDIYPTSYGTKSKTSAEPNIQFSLEDPIFRIKGRGVSLKGLG